MSALTVAYRLPLPGWPKAVFESDFAFRRSSVSIDGREVLHADGREELAQGVTSTLPGHETLFVRLTMDGDIPRIEVSVDGRRAPEESELSVSPSRSAWYHAFLALAASFAGFLASYLYLIRADTDQSLHAFKMAYHMAGWHLLLTFTLFPASVWGQRVGIRTVQAVSLLFFLIHVGIALANVGEGVPDTFVDLGIASLNTVSGLFFLWAVFYGNVAFRDMDPSRDLGDPVSARRYEGSREPMVGDQPSVNSPMT